MQFLARGAGYTLFLTQNEAVLALRKGPPESQEGPGFQAPHGRGERGTPVPQGVVPQPATDDAGASETAFPRWSVGTIRSRCLPIGNLWRGAPPERDTAERCHEVKPPEAAVVRMRFEGAQANRQPVLEGLERLPGRSNYFIGNDPKQWHTDIPQYAKVRYQGLYPGIDLVAYGNPQRLEYDFVVAPGVDPDVIRLAFEGAEALRLGEDGDLRIQVNSA